MSVYLINQYRVDNDFVCLSYSSCECVFKFHGAVLLLRTRVYQIRAQKRDPNAHMLALAIFSGVLIPFGTDAHCERRALAISWHIIVATLGRIACGRRANHVR